MRYAQLVCATSGNVGDDIQSIAAAARLPKVDLYVDREKLDTVAGPSPVCLIMNAWFMHSNRWPPSRFLRPIFVGFHVAPKSRDLIASHAPYLKRYEPIGTRDRGTAEFLSSLGIKAEVTYCLSLTFPTRVNKPAHGKVIIVDANAIQVPRSLRRRAVRLTHAIPGPGVQDATKLQCARELIEFYRCNASLVITTRLHCALPCVAMGIPVVFFSNPRDYRMSIFSEIGGTIHDAILHKRGMVGGTIGKAFDSIDWSLTPLDISPIKARLVEAVSTRIAALNSAEIDG
jgi:hypothetical protein